LSQEERTTLFISCYKIIIISVIIIRDQKESKEAERELESPGFIRSHSTRSETELHEGNLVCLQSNLQSLQESISEIKR
jgi:hypothetical protein